jgi:hypothetical protein
LRSGSERDDPQLPPGSVPDGAALPVLAMPVLAMPVVNLHALVAVVVYGSYTNSTLLDPDEIELLHRLAKAAATSHQQVRIAMLQREDASLTSENTAEKAGIDQLEVSFCVLAQRRVSTPPVEGVQ